MKVVLFCGGLGLRMKDFSEDIPKPMIHIGYRPILWHVMKYYAYFGHKDFILCLGHRGYKIMNYFLNYEEIISNDLAFSDENKRKKLFDTSVYLPPILYLIRELVNGNKKFKQLNNDIRDWNIEFVDTGIYSSIGERLKAVEEYLEGEEVFLANYADCLTGLYLPDLIDYFFKENKIASFICVKPWHSFHIVSLKNGNRVREITNINQSKILINGGYFVFRKEIFKYIKEEEDLINGPFQRLIEEGQLTGYKHNGFWACMDTFKDKQNLEDLYFNDHAPWEVWKSGQTQNAKVNSYREEKKRGLRDKGCLR